MENRLLHNRCHNGTERNWRPDCKLATCVRSHHLTEKRVCIYHWPEGKSRAIYRWWHVLVFSSTIEFCLGQTLLFSVAVITFMLSVYFIFLVSLIFVLILLFVFDSLGFSPVKNVDMMPKLFSLLKNLSHNKSSPQSNRFFRFFFKFCGMIFCGHILF